ncbi:phage baseplate assembly protein [Yersinia intermedia]|jgi:isocitrate dehydrogenase kinase/phosphatase|uniref:hypothetical protein n=1 Tax=Yersinia intermedia TaxID=631 RepID=UPI0005DCF413|nr:hypothetical protein [Yersinia intermedia]MCW8112259.1 hypothetical protein [Yersinia intermedia]CQD95880.1 phage baseplate assembly protein [Yersinia intermedia]CRY83440.1 phage baseplate assembly protein [Yersinia intermedia]VDZ50561.1 phage baseplate assembly protein [Yersinia intermedia]
MRAIEIILSRKSKVIYLDDFSGLSFHHPHISPNMLSVPIGGKLVETLARILRGKMTTAKYLDMSCNAGQTITYADYIGQSIADILITPVGSRVMCPSYGAGA